MRNKPLVSIISPTYNHQKYIGACIESVRNQTFIDWEMIIINDGSNDDTANIVNSFVQIDDRIKLYNQENIGIFKLAVTYNRALNLSNGKYIAILEGDDLWVPDKLERQVKIMEADPEIMIAWGLAQMLKESNESLGTIIPIKIQLGIFNNDPPGIILGTLFFENPIPAATILFRKDVLQKIGGFKQNFNLPLVDLPTIFEIVPYGKFYFDQHLLAIWRVSHLQITKIYPVEILNGRWNLSRYHLINLDQKTKDSFCIDLKMIDNYFLDELLISYARSGRYKLIRRDFIGARKDYKNAIFFKGGRLPKWRLRAIIGFLYSCFGKDIEGLTERLGKDSYKHE